MKQSNKGGVASGEMRQNGAGRLRGIRISNELRHCEDKRPKPGNKMIDKEMNELRANNES
jgi:hypothetical protein